RGETPGGGRGAAAAQPRRGWHSTPADGARSSPRPTRAPGRKPPAGARLRTLPFLSRNIHTTTGRFLMFSYNNSYDPGLPPQGDSRERTISTQPTRVTAPPLTGSSLGTMNPVKARRSKYGEEPCRPGTCRVGSSL